MGIWNMTQIGKAVNELKKPLLQYHQFSWASVTTFIENIWPIRYNGILIAKLMNVWSI